MCARMKHLPRVMLQHPLPPEVHAHGPLNTRQIAFRVRGRDGFETGIWDGNARRESRHTTWKDWTSTTVPAASIFEGGQEFSLAQGAALWAVYRFVSDNQAVVKVVTRPPLTEAEAAIHGRWPVQLVRNEDGSFSEPPFVE